MSFEEFQDKVNEARTTSEDKRNELKVARQKASNIKGKKAQLLREIGIDGRENNEQLIEINRSEKAFAQAEREGKTGYAGALLDEWAMLHEFMQFTDPIENIASLEDDCPILLFPLRLETRFKKVERDNEIVNQLWVRVFPDDIAINSFESDLSETEIRNGRSYWVTRWAAAGDVERQRGAWRSLASAHGPGRAYWLVGEENYVPLNWAGDPEKEDEEIILAIGTDEALVDAELDETILYWQAVWHADKDSTLLGQAWTRLVTEVGEERAADLVKDYKPANIDEPPPADFTREETAVRVEFVIFEQTDEIETKLHAWSQPPTAGILPERFVFLGFQKDEPVKQQIGNLVPPKLILGPDPALEPGEEFRLATKEDAEADPDIREGDLIYSENMHWMFDFDEAVAKGMGFRIDLTPEQAENGFERVFVLGVKLGAGKGKGQELLEELFAQHQSSRKGLAIIRQGTPTNNTEDDGSGYSWQHDPDDSFDIYFDETAEKSDSTDWFSKRDGRWLAELLGIDPLKLHAVENYYNTDITEAKAMQRALWPATMGHFLDSMMNPVFSEIAIEQTRLFFTRYVTGRGSLPAIRVGKQPYGILPATNYTGMGWFARQSDTPDHITSAWVPAFGTNFLSQLYQILLSMDQTWQLLQRQVAFVGKEGDPHQILLDIVGLHPDSVELYKRYANSFKQIQNIFNAQGIEHAGWYETDPIRNLLAAILLGNFGYVINDDNPAPDIFKKVFFEKAWKLYGDRIDKVPNSEVEPISKYTPGEDGKNYIGWLIEAARISHDKLRLQEGFIEDRPPTALLYLLLHHALDLSYINTSLLLQLSHGILTAPQVQESLIEPDFIHIEENNETESRWRHLYQRNVIVTGDPDLMIGQYIPLHVDELDEAAAFRDVLGGLALLENVPTARLERLMMEHIDTVSYRHDAWILGYLHLQLEQMRGLHTPDADNSPIPGVYIGAYGWLEDLIPENKELTPVDLDDELDDLFNPEGDLVEDESNAGYILAPSQNHAVTAAVLRNAHLSFEDPEDPEVKEELRIKLSSERVRLALQIIEGIQGGQSLPALLGYQFERGLHDRTDAEVDEFIFDLRDKFPLGAKKFKDTAPGADDPEYNSIDQIEARNVMDGVAFLEHVEKPGNGEYPFNLSLPAAGGGGQEDAINDEVRKLIEVNDAVADLALAESVHQVVLGNYERAAATLDTYSKGNFPPTPDVIKTPRSGTTLTHRVALQFKTDVSHVLGPDVTPRMFSEPAMNDWLAQKMPPMAEIECMVGYFDRVAGIDTEEPINMFELGLAPIDLLYLLNSESDQAMSALDDLIIHYVVAEAGFTPLMDEAIQIDYMRAQDDTKITVFAMTSLIASLRALLLRSKPLNAADVKLSNEAAKEDEETLTLDKSRVEAVADALALFIDPDPLIGLLTEYIEDLTGVIAMENVDAIVTDLETLMNRITPIFISIGAYGIPQAGIGFIYQWQQSMYSQLRTKVKELSTRWEDNREAYRALIIEYNLGLVTLSDPELIAILRKAELKIASAATAHLYELPGDYLVDLEAHFALFEPILDITMPDILDLHNLTTLVQRIQSLAVDIQPFDIAGLDIDKQLKQIGIFADDLKVSADNLKQEIENRVTRANDLLDSVTEPGDPLANVEFVKNAAKAIFGDEFVILPQFTLDVKQGTEWQNTLTDSAQSLRYLVDELDMDFPMDDWLYGASRVREKLYHLESTLFHIEGFSGATLNLIPSQFPYRAEDFWLGLQFPDKIPLTEEPFTIDEDKLLFTAVYAEAFDPTVPQCGLLLDEWTEVIPSRDETAGLTFHYDQPNSEPPQTLLLVTPSTFTGRWRWDDLVNTLHETLDMAKKRAVEPDHIDGTSYSLFLPPIVSLTSPLPLTATLNLALNNLVWYAEVVDDG